MKEEIAEIYDKMQDNEQEIIYSPADASTEPVEETPVERYTPLSDDDYDEFELDPNVDVSDSSYELPSFEKQTSADSPPEENQATYSLDANTQAAEPEAAETAAPTPAATEKSDKKTQPELAAVKSEPPDEKPMPEPESQVTNQPEATEPADTQTAAQSKPTAPAEDEVPHSVKTGGEVLMRTAMKEEAEAGKQPPAEAPPKPAAPPPRAARPNAPAGSQQGVLMVCPCEHACRIRVVDRYRGKALRCPKCSDIIFVPEDIKLQHAPRDIRDKYQQMTEAAALKRGGAKPGTPTTGTSGLWIHDQHVHSFAPEKLKLKPGSLEKLFTPMDLGFVPDGLILATLLKRPAVGKAADKKNAPVREEIRKHLLEGNNMKELPAHAHVFYKADDMSEISVVQPVPEGRESMFAGIPVFGRGRIAIRLPKHKADEQPNYISFSLSEFRKFARMLVETFSMPNIGMNSGVPMKDEFVEYKCHYTDQPIYALKSADLSYYELDPALNYEVAGYACECGKLTISEDGRKKEKIGKPGKGIQKAKCPKCKLKTTWEIYYTVPELQPKPKTDEDEEPSSETAGAKAE